MKRKIISIVVTICLIVTVLPLTTMEVSAATKPSVVTEATILKRIDELTGLHGKYFTTDKRRAYGSSDGRTEVTSVLRKNSTVRNLIYKNKGKTGYRPTSFDNLATHYCHDYGIKARLGWSCCGFGNFAEWYIFSNKCSDKVETRVIKANIGFNRANMKAYAKPGDVIRITGGIFSGHSAIVKSVNNSGVVVIDSNTSGSGASYTNKVRLHTIKYSQGYRVSISRATNSIYAWPNAAVSNDPASGKVKLSWGVKKGAAKYYVYRSTKKNSGYTLLGKTTGRTFTNTSAEPGKKYYYKVKAVSSSGKGLAWSYITVRTCDYARPVVSISCDPDTGKIKLSWKSVKGANYYDIYRSSTLNGKYTKVKRITTDTTAGVTCTYTDTGTVGGKNYYYKVRASNTGVSGAASAYSLKKGKTCDLPKPVVTVSNRETDGKPMLTWKQVAGAEKYEVYRSTTENGKYTKTYTTTKCEYVNTLAAAGGKYYYKVRAIDNHNKHAHSAYTLVSGSCILMAPDVQAEVSETDGKPLLTWDAVNGADSYRIFRGESEDGEYTELGVTVETFYIDAAAEEGKTYYYKVQSVATKNSEADSACSGIVEAICTAAEEVTEPETIESES